MVMCLYILLYWTFLLLKIISIYDELGPVVSVENVSKNLQILLKLLKIDYKGQ